MTVVMLHVGEAVTVVTLRPTEVWHAYVSFVHESGGYIEFRLDLSAGPSTARAGFSDEGVRWARGHSGPAVDALLAATALS